ncbi:hypothetical protein LNP20_28815 [Klebsiella pneumoniae subsp. pneumoniae]|nr:hypothetical protein [Klebsiella pneumoniae subsp. pneumoniae]
MATNPVPGKGVTKSCCCGKRPDRSRQSRAKDAKDQAGIDKIIDRRPGTVLKTNPTPVRTLSWPFLWRTPAAAASKGLPLYAHTLNWNGTPGNISMPVPMMNIINGGEHS